MLVTDWGLVSACEGPPLRVLRRVLSTNPAEKGPDLGMMGARSVNRRHFRLSMLSFEAEAAVQAEPVPPVLPVLYLDDVMCAVMKPEKLLVHRTEIANGDTVFAVQCVREQLGRRVWPVHRLDRGTSGVLVFACDADTASRLGRIMMAGEVKKRYAAVVRGWLEESVDCRHPLSLPEDPYLKKRRGPSEPQDARTVFIERARGEASVVGLSSHRHPASSSAQGARRPFLRAGSRRPASASSRPSSSRAEGIRSAVISSGLRIPSSGTPPTGRAPSTVRSRNGSVRTA